MGTITRGTRNVLRNPIRLVIVSVLLGTSLMFAAAMVALNAGTQERLADVRGSVGTIIDILPAGVGPGGGSVVSVQGGGGGATISEETLRAAAKVPGVESVEGRIERPYKGSELKGSAELPEGFAPAPGSGASNGTLPPMVFGVSPDDSRATRVADTAAKMVAGRGLTEDDAEANVAIMGKALAEANGLDVGSRITVEGKKVEIVGLYETGQSFGDNSFVLPLKTMQRLYGIEGVSSATVHVGSGTQAAEVADRLRETLGNKVDVISQEDLFAGTFKALEAARRNTLIGLVGALATAAFVIVFAVFLIVRERTKEIGVLKALGASNWHVVGQFGVEVLALSGIAAIAAAGLLALAGPAIASAFDLTGSGGPGSGGGPEGGISSGPVAIEMGGSPAGGAIDPLSAGLTVETLLLLLGLGVVLAVIASAIPALYVARTKPAEVLRQA